MSETSKTDWGRLAKLNDADIDTSEIPGLGENFYRRAELCVPVKQSMTICLDADVLECFKGQGEGYQARINQLLRHYIQARPGLRGLPLMNMHNPPHPGEFITEIYLEPNGISGRELAEKLGVAPSTLSRVLKGSRRVSPEMALRLSIALGRSPESWLTIQDAYDLWIARRRVDLQQVGTLAFA